MTMQIIAGLTGIISALNLFILGGIFKRLERLENLFINRDAKIWNGFERREYGEGL